MEHARKERAPDRTREQHSLIKVFGRMKYPPTKEGDASKANKPFFLSKNREECQGHEEECCWQRRRKKCSPRRDMIEKIHRHGSRIIPIMRMRRSNHRTRSLHYQSNRLTRAHARKRHRKKEKSNNEQKRSIHRCSAFNTSLRTFFNKPQHALSVRHFTQKHKIIPKKKFAHQKEMI